MGDLAEAVTTELQCLIDQPLGDCWRAVDMQIFEFGPRKKIINKKGDDVEVGEFSLHVQCTWRLVDGTRIIFGKGDLHEPADESIPLRDFDYDKQDSLLDVTQRAWFAERRPTLPRVVRARGDAYGGFQIDLEGGFALEAIPSYRGRDRDDEHWRLLGHRSDGRHFVVCAGGADFD